jgi:hypothetical protein
LLFHQVTQHLLYRAMRIIACDTHNGRKHKKQPVAFRKRCAHASETETPHLRP